MNLLEALAATVGTRTIARPVTGLREGTGYFVADNRVYWYDRTELSADIRTHAISLAHWLPAWEVLAGEWETVAR